MPEVCAGSDSALYSLLLITVRVDGPQPVLQVILGNALLLFQLQQIMACKSCCFSINGLHDHADRAL